MIEKNTQLEDLYQKIKKTIADKFDIDEDFITIMEIEKGSVKTTFVVNLDHIRSQLETRGSVPLSSH